MQGQPHMAAERNQKASEQYIILELWYERAEDLEDVDHSNPMKLWPQGVVRHPYFKVDPVLRRGYLKISWMIPSARALTLYFCFAAS